jgi:hypothetical protein
MAIYSLYCPKCGKLVGKTIDKDASPSMLLWCRRCKCEITPSMLKCEAIKRP